MIIFHLLCRCRSPLPMPPMVLVASTHTEPGQHCSLWTQGLLEQVSEPAANTASKSRLRRAVEDDPELEEEEDPLEEEPPLLPDPPEMPEMTEEPEETYCGEV